MDNLPELPLSSPPEAWTGSCTHTIMAAAATAAWKAGKDPKPATIPACKVIELGVNSSMPDRKVVPVGPVRARGLLLAPMASIDSEGSWIARPSGRREPAQLALSRSIDPWSKGCLDFTTSYKVLNGNDDTEHFQPVILPTAPHRTNGASVGAVHRKGHNGSDLDAGCAIGAPAIQHVVRRQPMLVLHSARVKSKEGLVAEYAEFKTPHGDPRKNSFDAEEPDKCVEKVQCVSIDDRHARANIG